MYSHTLRVARSGGKELGLVLGRIDGTRGGAAARVVRSVSATSATGAPVPGDQGVAMEHPKQQQLQPQVPTQDAAANSKRIDAHKTIRDVMSHSFGEGYATRSEEEGFGGVYGRPDPEEHGGADDHPEYDTSQGSEVKEEKEKEKARHHRDEKHAT